MTPLPSTTDFCSGCMLDIIKGPFTEETFPSTITHVLEA
jgi:hypothetical protein